MSSSRAAGFRKLFTSGASLYLLAALVVYAGWLQRDLRYLVADEGLGYWLGIIGGSMMLVLLLYPLRKRTRIMRGWGSVRAWFRVHHLFAGRSV